MGVVETYLAIACTHYAIAYSFYGLKYDGHDIAKPNTPRLSECLARSIES